jgi:hypothetical protein
MKTFQTFIGEAASIFDDPVRNAIYALHREISHTSHYTGSDYLQDPQLNHWREPNGWSFDVRYWGQWENPADAEDEEDYDWQVPTPDTVKRLNDLVARARKQFPTVEITWRDEGEKNHLTFTAKAK